MKYEYRCPECGWVIRSDTRADYIHCTNPHCTGIAKRVWGFTFSPMIHSHYNPSTGTVISSKAQHRSELQRASDAMNARGIPSNFQPVDWMDKEKLGVTNEGLDSTYDALKAQGKDEQARRLKALMDD